ncbi:MAG: thioredoxin-disulfide reductase [Campylobacteraceae bacterium]|jgi:thioredoxin reductase (NADPH)|nr:thioredoxin-disulfide reductase [Campylobacteraceae bacterium]
MSTVLDLAIIGGGPAGLTAGMYATRGGLGNVVMYEKGVVGGQITKSSEIENYPGITQVVSGLELMEKWPEQVMRFGLKYEMSDIIRVSRADDGLFNILLEGGESVKAKSVIVCTGSVPKKSGVEGEDTFYGRGVSFCATCDGFFYKNKEVAVLGGGDAALEEALFLSNICSKVYLVHRRDEFRASPATVQRVNKNSKIELVLNSTVKKIYGDVSGVNGVLVVDKAGVERDLKVPGVFVFVGMKVNNEVLLQENGEFLCEMSKGGEVVVDLDMNTSLKGLFAAGDIRINAAKQVVCAAGDGATAAINAISYLESLHE